LTLNQVRRPGQTASKAFLDILGKAPHALTSAELDSIEAIANLKKDNNGWPIQVKDARTGTRSGKPALIITTENEFYGCSRSADVNGTHRNLALYFSGDQTGSLIEVIDFSTMARDFDQLSGGFQTATNSIEWKH
jgi:hypothetical protein